MRVHDVERVIPEVERVEIADRELDIRPAAGVAVCLLDDVARRIDAEDSPGGHRVSRVSPPGTFRIWWRNVGDEPGASLSRS